MPPHQRSLRARCRCCQVRLPDGARESRACLIHHTCLQLRVGMAVGMQYEGTPSRLMLSADLREATSVSTNDCPTNHDYLWYYVGADALRDILQGTGVLSSPTAGPVLESLLGMACGRAMCLLNVADSNAGASAGNDGIKAMSWKAEALVLLVSLCHAMSVENASRALDLVSCIASVRCFPVPEHAGG